MTIKKNIILLFSLLAVSYSTNAQIGGLSASKLATLCTETVPAKSIEFEPLFTINFTENAWDNAGNNFSIFPQNDSINISSSFGFRFTYGVVDNLETGISVPIDMSSIQYGIKYQIPLSNQDVRFGVMTGFNAPLGNKTISKKSNTINESASIVAGIINTYHISEKLCVDTDIQYQVFTRKTLDYHKCNIFVNSDIGYFVGKDVQLVLGFNYFYTDNNNHLLDEYKLTINPGLTIERAKNFILVLNFPYDLKGKNTQQSFGCGMALTILID